MGRRSPGRPATSSPPRTTCSAGAQNILPLTGPSAATAFHAKARTAAQKGTASNKADVERAAEKANEEKTTAAASIQDEALVEAVGSQGDVEMFTLAETQDDNEERAADAATQEEVDVEKTNKVRSSEKDNIKKAYEERAATATSTQDEGEVATVADTQVKVEGKTIAEKAVVVRAVKKVIRARPAANADTVRAAAAAATQRRGTR